MTYASDDPNYPFPPSGDVNVGLLSKPSGGLLQGETKPMVDPDAMVVLSTDHSVPDELQGVHALVIARDDSNRNRVLYTVKTRDEHNAILTVTDAAFAETHKGNTGVHDFGT